MNKSEKGILKMFDYHLKGRLKHNWKSYKGTRSSFDLNAYQELSLILEYWNKTKKELKVRIKKHLNSNIKLYSSSKRYKTIR